MVDCPGKKVSSDDNRTWYLDKNKSSMLYTCCEGCFNNYIKGTDNEQNFIQINGGAANCDYNFYNSDCNFIDCSITTNNIRLSITDTTGRRYKLSTNEENTFLMDSICDYIITLENLVDNKIEEISRINIEKIKINTDTLTIDSDINFSPYVIDLPIDNSEMSDIDDEIWIEISKYDKKTILHTSDEFNTIDNIDFIMPNSQNFKHKGFLGLCIYSADPNNDISIYFKVKTITPEAPNDIEIII